VEITIEIVSTCHGVVDRLLQTEGAYICEHEPLCLVKSSSGKMIEVPASFSGYLKDFSFKQGDRVQPGMIIARLTESAHQLCASCD